MHFLNAFGDFRKNGMRKFLNKFFPGFVPWHSKINARKRKEVYVKYKKQLIKIFKNIDFIALTTDAWKRRIFNIILL